MAFDVSSVPLSLTTMQGLAPQLGNPIELAGNTQARERGVDHQAKTLSGEVIDHGEDSEAPTAHQRVSHEVDRPTQIAILRDGHRRPGAEGSFAATALAHCEPLLPIEPVELLGIQLDALALEHHAEPPIAEP